MVITAVTTSLRSDEVVAIDALLPGESRAATLRVLLRYAMRNPVDVKGYLNAAMVHSELSI